MSTCTTDAIHADTATNNSNENLPIHSPIGQTIDEEMNDSFPEANDDPSTILKKLRISNVERIIIGHLNINSIRNKLEALSAIVTGNLDILLISETKIDNTFPDSQFLIDGFSAPIRKDRNSSGGGLLLYIRNDIPCKLLKAYDLPNEFEGFFVEVNLRKRKYLLSCSYNSHKSVIGNHIDILSKGLDWYSSHYDNIIIIGDLNSETTEKRLSEFMDMYKLQNLIKEATCFKNPSNPSCIDLILTNHPKSFQNSQAVETGLSDFHRLTVSVLKMFYKKQHPKIIKYRDYKHFSNQTFQEELVSELSNQNVTELDSFVETFLTILNKHAPKKQKCVRANQSPFMNKSLQKEIMKRTRLQNRFSKSNNETHREAYNKQRNYCVHLTRKTKKDYYENLNVNDVTDNKQFWKTVKPFLSDKTKVDDKITLVDNGEIVTEDCKTAEIFNEYFSMIIPNLNITPNTEVLSDVGQIDDPVLKAIKKYEKHPSIIAISNKTKTNSSFTFHQPSRREIEKQIQNLDVLKACREDDIPTKIIKENSEIFTDVIEKNLSTCFVKAQFPNSLKLADVRPIHKKDSRNEKSNYRPVSILSNISKIYERIIAAQITVFFDNILSKYQCGFRKGFSAQHCLLRLIETWRKYIDSGKVAGALLTDLSKAFDCISHDLLIAKLYAYGFDMQAITLVHSYLSDRKQRVKVSNTFSSWSNIIYGVPQGSILGPLLFNIYICDLFLSYDVTDIANYADDNTPYCGSDSNTSVIDMLERASVKLFEWFKDNNLKANADKSHLLISTDNKQKIKINETVICSSKAEKLLGILIDNKLTFDQHVSNLCVKANQKLHALSRISSYMSTKKRKLIMNSFITSQFGYCPLVWMFHSRELNNRINRIHERSLRIVYNDKQSTFHELLMRDNSVTIHQNNIRKLAIEIFKVKNNFSPEIMHDVIEIVDSSYNLRRDTIFKKRNIRTVRYGTETIAFIAPKIWDILPNECKTSTNLQQFKTRIKHWTPSDCPCRLCKIYVCRVGFL